MNTKQSSAAYPSTDELDLPRKKMYFKSSDIKKYTGLSDSRIRTICQKYDIKVFRKHNNHFLYDRRTIDMILLGNHLDSLEFPTPNDRRKELFNNKYR